MDWGRLFLSAEGRIGRQDYWIAVLILILAWFVSHVAHIFAPLLWLLLLYPWVCVLAKRLHDFGHSGWLILLPTFVGIFAVTGAAVFGGAALIGTIVNAAHDASGEIVWDWASVLGALGVALAFVLIAGLFKLLFIIWVGARSGDRGPNRFGPDPRAPIMPPPSTPPV